MSRSPVEVALRHVTALATGLPLDPRLRVTCSFHPDRWSAPGSEALVLERMATEGRYLSQFVTGTSNGALTAYAGGDRHRWESRIFGSAYDGQEPVLRPKYGALDHRRRPT